MIYALVLTIVLGGVWLAWSGHFESLLLSLGAASCIGVVLLMRRIGPIDGAVVPFRLVPRALVYFPWLLWQIVLSNIHVAGCILRPGLPIAPRVMRVRAGQRTDLGRVIYANSITVTPGTVSIAVDGDDIIVHALTRSSAEGLASGEMDRRVSWLEGR